MLTLIDHGLATKIFTEHLDCYTKGLALRAFSYHNRFAFCMRALANLFQKRCSVLVRPQANCLGAFSFENQSIN